MTVTVTPLRDEVLLRLRPIPATTGLIVRVSHAEPTQWADVLAVGDECIDVQVGWVVLVNPLIGTAVGDDLIVPESSVLAYE